jgi:hypothetical protein
MVEAGTAQAHDVGSPTMVLAMTRLALARARSGHAAVKSRRRREVRCHIFVAAQAQVTLPLAVCFVMAGAAIILGLGVRLAQGSWHQQLLEGGAMRPRAG